MKIEDLIRLATTAVTIAQQGQELIEQVTDSIARSKEALNTRDRQALMRMLEESHERTQEIGARLNEKLTKLANG